MPPSEKGNVVTCTDGTLYYVSVGRSFSSLNKTARVFGFAPFCFKENDKSKFSRRNLT